MKYRKNPEEPSVSSLVKAIVYFLALMMERFSIKKKEFVFNSLHGGNPELGIRTIIWALKREHPVNVSMGVSGVIGSTFGASYILSELKEKPTLDYIQWFFSRYMYRYNGGFLIGRPDPNFGKFDSGKVIIHFPIEAMISFG